MSLAPVTWEIGDIDVNPDDWLDVIIGNIERGVGDWLGDRALQIPSGGIFQGFPVGAPMPIPPVISEIPTTWPDWSLEPILETRPGEIPDPYPGSEAAGNVDPSAIIGPYQGADTPEQTDDVTEDETVAHDWGHLIRQGTEAIFGMGAPEVATFAPAQSPAQTQAWLGGPTAAAASGADCDGMAWSGGTPPKGYKVVNYCGRGVLRKVRRRRRRRLLTASDSRDIATIVGLVGKGQMASALINRR